jgi:hypothetical protein
MNEIFTYEETHNFHSSNDIRNQIIDMELCAKSEDSLDEILDDLEDSDDEFEFIFGTGSPPSPKQSAMMTNMNALTGATIKLEICNHNICCLCGVAKEKHKCKEHKFFASKPQCKCKKCGKFFYEHNHTKSPCFTPHVNLIHML